MKPSGYDQRGVPVYCEPVVVVDMWVLFDTGRAGSGHTLGEASADDIKDLMKVVPDIETDRYAPEIPSRIEYGSLAFAFDDRRTLQAVYFGGDDGEHLPPGINEAAAKLDAFGDAKPSGDIWAGNASAIVRLAGWPATGFATLPRFINCMPDDAAPSLSAMPMRKSISIEVRRESRRLKAEFILKAFKSDYGEPFHIDYCLHTLSVMDQRIVAATRA